jgi:hypothetical protein
MEPNGKLSTVIPVGVYGRRDGHPLQVLFAGPF